MDPSGITTILSAIWEISKITKQLIDVPETSRVFVRILEQVARDNEYANKFYKTIPSHIKYNCIRFEWIREVITSNSCDVIDFMKFVGELNPDSPSFKQRASFLLMTKEKTLNDWEKRLCFSHGRLLAAVNTMDGLAPQPDSSRDSSVSSPAARPLRSRASPGPPQCLSDTKDIGSILGRLEVADEKAA